MQAVTVQLHVPKSSFLCFVAGWTRWSWLNGLIGVFARYFVFWQPDFGSSHTRPTRDQRCWVIVGDLLCWPNNTRVQVYFGCTTAAAIWDYSAESPVWKQVSGQRGDFRGVVFRTGRRDGPAGRRKPPSGVVKCLAQVHRSVVTMTAFRYRNHSNAFWNILLILWTAGVLGFPGWDARV